MSLALMSPPVEAVPPVLGKVEGTVLPKIPPVCGFSWLKKSPPASATPVLSVFGPTLTSRISASTSTCGLLMSSFSITSLIVS